ncbi:MAG: hypothetical protein RQ751_13945 [Longimicrobiales bacterium]|nr:hypothetical protein [Longimicrobiales bacterium]
MRWGFWGVTLVAVVSAACTERETIVVPAGAPDAPRALAVSYHNRAVTVTWELGPAWDGEAFRVYARRAGAGDFLLVGEVTSCSGGACRYTDVNIEEGATYDYFVAAVGFDGQEAASAETLRITVPSFTAPPIPGGLEVVALDGAAYLRWDDRARDASDFSFYRVYLWFDDAPFLLGETDSQGFLDELAENGLTYRYFIAAVDEYGHESEGSALGEGTPRPDYHGEVLWDYFAVPGASGFVFREDESLDPLVSGDDPFRHLRLETDADGWWLVPGPGVTVQPQGWETTALRCGPGADAECVALDLAPTSGYVAVDLWLQPGSTYVLQVPGDDGLLRFGAIRVEMLGFDQEGDPLMIFDWAFQLQPGNPALAPAAPLRTRMGGMGG